MLGLGWSIQKVQGQQPAALLNGQQWRIAPEDEVKESGEQISKADFAPLNWVVAQVPGTVFGAYVLAGKEKDPNFGDNIYHVDLAKYDRNFWYRTEFTVPEAYRRQPGVAEPGRGQPRRRRFRQRAEGGFNARVFPARLF